VQLGVKKVAENEEGKKRGPRDEKGRKMVPKRSQKWSNMETKTKQKKRGACESWHLLLLLFGH